MDKREVEVELSEEQAALLEQRGGLGGFLEEKLSPRRFSVGVCVCVAVFVLGAAGGWWSIKGGEEWELPLVKEREPEEALAGLTDRLFTKEELNRRKEKSGRTLFFEILVNGSLELVELGFLRGADPNIPQYAYEGPPGQGEWIPETVGNTAIVHLLKAQRYERAYQLLVAYPQINPSITNYLGASALSVVTGHQKWRELTPEQFLVLAQVQSVIESRRANK